MAYTNRAVLRREIGDSGTFARDEATGDGSTKIFYLSTQSVLGDSQSITVAGTAMAEPADYTLDDGIGRVTFAVAPANLAAIVIAYQAVRVPDADLDEALRLYGLTATATADPGPAVALLRAGVMVCEWVASSFAGAVDIEADGTSLSRSQAAIAWERRAAALRTRVQREGVGLASSKIVRLDGYNRDEVDSSSVNEAFMNPRRRFYGEPDEIP